MSPSDKKEYRLATPKMRLHLRHTVTKPRFTLPKPYRRTGAPPDELPRSRRKLVFYGVSALVIVILVIQIAELARQSRRERALPIVAAATGNAPADTMPAAGSGMAPQPPAPYESLNEPSPVAEPVDDALAAGRQVPAPSAGAAVVEAGTHPAPATMAVLPSDEAVMQAEAQGASRPLPKPGAAPLASLPKKTKPPRTPPAAAAEPPDPDVVLVTAILTLAPLILGEEAAPEPACGGAQAHDAACAELQGMVP